MCGQLKKSGGQSLLLLLLNYMEYNTRANKIRGQNQFEELRLCVLAVHLGMNLFEQQDHYSAIYC